MEQGNIAKKPNKTVRNILLAILGVLVLMIVIPIVATGGKAIQTDKSSSKAEYAEFERQQRIAKTAVEKGLKSPKSAKFSTDDKDWIVSDENGLIVVSSFVDANNEFNATLRNTFTVKYKYNAESKEYAVKYLKIGDDIIYDYIS
jgi:hypothetical protein